MKLTKSRGSRGEYFAAQFLIGLAIVLFCGKAFGQQASYEAKLATGPVAVDGHMNEADWQKADVIDIEEEIRGEGFEAPQQKTQVRMLWSEQFLYVFVVIYEEHIMATLTKRDAIIYRDNDFELFVDTDRDGKRYFEIEVNAYNTIMDLYMDRPYKEGGNALLTYDIPMESAVQIDGTINNGSDTDNYWAVEMKIPKSHLTDHGESHLIKAGDTWRMNFSRVEWDFRWTGEQYEKLIDPKKGKPQEKNWVWAPTGKIDIHVPDKWATVKFVEQ